MLKCYFFSDKDCAGVANGRGEIVCKDCKIFQRKAKAIESFIRQWKPNALAIAVTKEK